MPNVARAHPRLPHVTLNSDGQRHPLLNTLTCLTLVFGIVAFALGFVVAGAPGGVRARAGGLGSSGCMRS